MDKKYEKLKEYFKELGKVAIAFSSGVDSTFLLKAAHDTLGDKAVAITAKSNVFPKREWQEAEAFCKKEGIKQLVVEADQLSMEDFRANPYDRCYICKKALFTKFIEVANENGFSNILEGTNIDDLGDYRPGIRAIEELQIKSPLRMMGFRKAEIRELSEKLGIETFDKASFACLASRFPYGETITEEKLLKIEKAEDYLLGLGLKQIRVRIHGEDVARIEIEDRDIKKVLDNRIEIDTCLKDFGFKYVALDLNGYKMGNMNEIKYLLKR